MSGPSPARHPVGLDGMALLTAKIDQCLSHQVADLRRAQARIARRVAQDLPVARDLSGLEARIASSCAAVQARRDSVPAINYPDELPVVGRREDIAAAIRDHQVVILAGETGSGKTTQLPKICLELGLGARGLIGHTQPRRIAARTVASRIAEELRVPLGGLVGYQVRFADQSSEHTLVKLMTDGVLLAEIPRDRLLQRYDTLIIDEAHERSLNVDFLLGYLKQILPQRPDLKIIITSATIDVERFARHFDAAPVIEVSGRGYPVEIRYRPPPEEDADPVAAAVTAIADLVSAPGRGDVLAFFSSEREIREASVALRKLALNGVEVLPLYARLGLAEQSRVFQSHRGVRVVLATNVAETSLTVPGIRYVVDTGRARISRYSYRTKVQRLPIEAISRASANQRAGRCGRIGPGVCVRLYGEDDFAARPEYTDPEIQRTNLAAVILRMLELRLGDVRDFPFLDPPDGRLVNDGFQLLAELGAIDAESALTVIGRTLARLPVDPRLGRMLVAAVAEGCLSEALVIVAGLSVQDPRERPADKRQAADERHRQWADPQSDFVALLNLWRHAELKRQELSRSAFESHCRREFVSPLRLREWRDLHHQLHLVCRELGWRDGSVPAATPQIHRALLAGLLTLVGLRGDNREYQGVRNQKFFIFPGSGVAKAAPRWIMAAELIETSRLYASNCGTIEPEWLVELAAHLVKKSYSEPHYNARAGQVMAWEKQSLYGLVIQERKAVAYGAIDPALAREVFIQGALVDGGYARGGKGAFFARNAALVAELHDLEERFRRRDLLADERELYAFYEERVPADVVGLRAFERWRRDAEQGNPELLCVPRERLLRNAPAANEVAQFPGVIAWNGRDYSVRYRFELGHPEDGISILVPVAILHEVPAHRFDWLVPGLLRDKCIELVKTLPRQWRRPLVPVPDTVDRLLTDVEPGDRPLVAVLSERIRRVMGLDVPPDAWQPERLDAFYRANFRLEDEQGALVDQGRDLAVLKRQYRDTVRASLREPDGPGTGVEVTGLKRWSLDVLPEAVTLTRGGLRVTAYPGLVDEGDSAAVRLFDTPATAAEHTRLGLLRLAATELAATLKYLRKELFKAAALVLAAAQLPARDVLVEDLVEAALQRALFAGHPTPRDAAAFATCLAHRSEVVAVAQRLEAQVLAWGDDLKRLRAWHTDRQARYPAVVADGRAQLDFLLRPHFLRDTGAQWLDQYPRYFKAACARFERLPGQVERDAAATRTIAGLIAWWRERVTGWREGRLSDRGHGTDGSGAAEEALERFRFLLEEYRISLYAQQLKTLAPVSEKRLTALCEEFDRQFAISPRRQ
jgi:ATP-dependent helicase HrpA